MATFNISDLSDDTIADAGQIMFRNPSSGDTIKHKRATFASLLTYIYDLGSATTAWDDGTTYATAGTVIERALMHFAATGKATNLNKDPLNQTNLAYWYPSPGLQTLMQRCKEPFIDLHPTLDRASTGYTSLLKIDTLTLGGTAYDFWMIALDGSTVTGDADLVAALDVGGANQHALIDLIAPDVAGTRTLIDMGERVMAGQSTSGNNDTQGEVLEDRLQGHFHNINRSTSSGLGGTNETVSASGANNQTDGVSTVQEAVTDVTNGTPRTGATTRPKELTGGSYAILSMVPA